MDELKHRVLGLIQKQGPKIPSMGFSDDVYLPKASPGAHQQQHPQISINSKTCAESDRPADQDILEGIRAAYFSPDVHFDISRFELDNLVADQQQQLDCEAIQRELKQLKQQHQVVSSRVLQLILQQQGACAGEFANIQAVHARLEETLEACRGGRDRLATARGQFVSSLGILANYRKRQLVRSLLGSLRTIRGLHRTDERLQELLNEEDYSAAILLLQERQSVAAAFKHFACVAALSNRLQETLVMTEEQLDLALARTCYHFDEAVYGRLQAAYKLLGKTQTSMNQLHMHYTSTVHNCAFSSVHAYAEDEYQQQQQQQPEHAKRQYKQLCASVPASRFGCCLIDLCRSLFSIAQSYRQVHDWHAANSPDAADLEENLDREYIRKKLDAGLERLWNDIQIKMSQLVSSRDLSDCKFEQFVQVLAVVSRLIDVGEEFCSSRSEELQASLRRQSVSYFKAYHASRLEELTTFLDNEAWEPCPVRADFDAFQLREFRPLRRLRPRPSPESCSDAASSSGHNFFARPAPANPFEASVEETTAEEHLFYCSDEEESDEDLEQHREAAPLLSNTAISLLRTIGKYLQMARLLRPIALDIVMCMNQLFDHYMLAMRDFFAADSAVSSAGLFSAKLASALKRIEDSTVGASRPRLSPQVDLSRAEELHGLAARAVGVESLVFIAGQFELIKGHLEDLVQPQQKKMVQQFYSHIDHVAESLRRPIYMAPASKAFDLAQVLAMIGKVNWEIKEVISQHNSYVDSVLRDVQIFSMRLEDLSRQMPIGAEVRSCLWENIAHVATHALVEGFSSAKRCSNAGRALMQLDFAQFLSKYEKLTGIRPMPHKEYVEAYVKAYYLPEPDLEAWLRDRSEYSAKHKIGLVSCVFQSNKKTKQRLVASIEESDR